MTCWVGGRLLATLVGSPGLLGWLAYDGREGALVIMGMLLLSIDELQGSSDEEEGDEQFADA